MIIRAIAAISFILLTSCGNHEQPAPSQLASATVLSNHSIEVVSYEIPKGILRGALWPQKDKKFFEIWTIDDNQEKFFELKAPPEFVNYEREVTDRWQFDIIEKSDFYKKYLAHKKDGSKSLHVELPNKKRDYSFAVLKNSGGDEILIFMDISEKIVDAGLFGYVTITDKT
jgi:hypothetical protein